VLGGLLAFVASALAGQLVALAEWIAGARAYGARLPMKLGWLYLVSFHRVGIQLTSTRPFGGAPAPPAGTYVYTLRIAVLAGTILAGALLYRAGRATARRAGGGAWWVGVAVAPGYAAPILLGSLIVTLRFPDAGLVSVRPVVWEALVFPLAFAAAVGAAGGVSTVSLTGRVARFRSWLRAGWRMFASAIVLAFVGFVVLAGVRPDVSGAYLRWIAHEGQVGATVATHHLIMLPDQSVWILAPAMGGCDSFFEGTSQTTTLCFRTLTVRPGVSELVFGPSGKKTLPPAFLFFVLVPAIATVAGSARSTHSRSVFGNVVNGIASGVAFAAFVWLAAIVSRISLVGPATETLLGFGPEPTQTGLLALVWGIVGGAIGAALLAMRPQEGEAVPDAELAPAPPRPTSV
jgi:hypothetical protein